MALLDSFPALRHRNYRLFFGGQALSLIGSWMQIAAQGWLVTLLAASEKDANVWQTRITTVGSLPMFFGAFFGGLVADRLSKHGIILRMQAVQGVLAGGLAALVLTGSVRIWHVLVFALLTGLTNVFDIPSRQSFVIEMVGKEDLPNAIGLNASLFNGARVIGPAVATSLIALLGRAAGEMRAIGQCFLVNALSYAAVLVGLLAMRGDFRPRGEGKEPPLVQLREAAGYLRSHRAALTLMGILAAGSLFMSADWILLPSLAKYTYHADARGYGLLMTLRGAGSLAAALTMATLSDRVRRGPLLTAASLVWPVVTLTAALSGSLQIACWLAPLAGFAMICCFVTSNTLLQISTPDAMRGRVMGVHAFLMMGLTPVGSLWAGFVAQHSNAAIAIAAGSSVTFACALIAALGFPELRRAGSTLAPSPGDDRAI